MSVVNPGIPRVKVTDPTVLSIKELISRGGAQSLEQPGTQESLSSLCPMNGVWPRPRTLINMTENPLGLCFQQWVIHCTKMFEKCEASKQSIEFAPDNFRGISKDSFVAKLANLFKMIII